MSLTIPFCGPVQSESDPEETEEEATARKKLKADKAAALSAKKKGNELYSAKVNCWCKPCIDA